MMGWNNGKLSQMSQKFGNLKYSRITKYVLDLSRGIFKSYSEYLKGKILVRANLDVAASFIKKLLDTSMITPCN